MNRWTCVLLVTEPAMHTNLRWGNWIWILCSSSWSTLSGPNLTGRGCVGGNKNRPHWTQENAKGMHWTVREWLPILTSCNDFIAIVLTRKVSNILKKCKLITLKMTRWSSAHGVPWAKELICRKLYRTRQKTYLSRQRTTFHPLENNNYVFTPNLTRWETKQRLPHQFALSRIGYAVTFKWVCMVNSS